MKRTTLLAIVVICALMVPVAQSAERAKVKVKPVLTGLYNPCGVAVQPGTGDVFVSDSGALKVVRCAGGKKGAAKAVITGFPQDIYGKGPMYDIGPLGLVFLDRDTLAVGGGGNKDGDELLRIYTVPPKGDSIKADDMKYKLGPLGPSDDTLKGEGNFYGVAATKNAIYITCNGDDTKGWVSRVELNNGTPGDLKPYIKTKVAVEVDAPVGVTISPDGKLMIGQMGEMNVPNDSLLSTYDPATGKLLDNVESGLFDIAGLAYSPKTGKLYAVDFAWMDDSKGGLFELQTWKDGDETQVKATKITSLDKPTALAFAPDGTLYVTQFGTAKEGSDKKPGSLVKITGDL